MRNDTIVTGTIEKVDSDMNIELSNAIVGVDKFYCTQIQDLSSNDESNLGNASLLDPQTECKRDKDLAQSAQCTIVDKSKAQLVSARNPQAATDSQHDDTGIDFNATDSADDNIPGDDDDYDDCYDSDQSDDNTADETNDRTQTQGRLEYYIVKGSPIRHIDLPNQRDLMTGARSEIERLRIEVNNGPNAILYIHPHPRGTREFKY